MNHEGIASSHSEGCTGMEEEEEEDKGKRKWKSRAREKEYRVKVRQEGDKKSGGE